MKFKIEDLAWQKHMRQTDLARATGLRWATIHKYWDNINIKRPDMIVLEKIATALGVTVNDLIVRDEQAEQKQEPTAA
jgi:DNA-binding Xre family transcriptional regulator